MRSPRAAFIAAKLLILLPLGSLVQVPASAATKCPSGQILRVSQGVCVPKAENSALLRHGTKKPRAVEAAAPPPARKPIRDAAADADRPDRPSRLEVAQHETPAPASEPAPSPLARAQATLSPFGELFVGAFRSTVSTGLSAFR
jgi:hypothetical protein